MVGKGNDLIPGVPDKVLRSVGVEVTRQDGARMRDYDTNRDGVRVAVAALEDETREAREAWDVEKGGPLNGTWPHVYEEVEQVVAVGLRLLRALDKVNPL